MVAEIEVQVYSSDIIEVDDSDPTVDVEIYTTPDVGDVVEVFTGPPGADGQQGDPGFYRVFYDTASTSYPPRPSVASVEWVGPTIPPDAVAGVDTWIQTS